MHVVWEAAGGERDLDIGFSPEATMDDLVTALDPAAKLDTVFVDGVAMPTSYRLVESGLGDGSVISVVAPCPQPTTPRVAELRVIGGWLAGGRWLLEAGDYRIGSDPDCEVCLPAPGVRPFHAVIRVSPAGEGFIEPLDGSLVTVNTVVARVRTRLATGGLIRMGQSAWEFGPVGEPAARPGSKPEGGLFNRPPRPQPSRLPVEVKVPARPVVPLASRRPGWATLLVPLAVGAVVALLFSPTMAAFALLGPLLILSNWFEDRRRERNARCEGEAQYVSALDRFGRELEAANSTQVRFRRAHLTQAPEVVTRALTGSARLWERRPNHPDFMGISLGIATLPSEPHLSGPVDDDDAVAVLDRHRWLEDVPVGIELTSGTMLGIAGRRTLALALARWVVVQGSVNQGPADTRFAIVTDRPEDWGWTKWLPHTASDPTSGRRLLAADLDDIDEVVARLAHQISPDMPPVPLTVLIVDAETLDPLRRSRLRSIQAGSGAPVAGVAIASTSTDLPSLCNVVVEISDTGRSALRRPPADDRVSSLLPIGLPSEIALACSRALARHKDPEVAEETVDLPGSVALATLFEPEPFSVQAVLDRWAGAGPVPRLMGPVGVTERGPLMIDLVSDGPHGLIAGTTGSGKSELLRSLIVSLSASVGPDHLNFALIDYKGGSAFDACARLPHVVGVVTDLDEHLGRRALTCLEAEVRYREARLRGVGATDLPDYLLTIPTDPLPRLVVVIDEFAALASELPGFVPSLVDIAQRGRSLGVHLLLATQRPNGVIAENIRANTNMRVAMRVHDVADSHDVLSNHAAAAIPRARPGRGYVRLGPRELIPFQAAQVTMNSRPGRTVPVEVRPFSFGWEPQDVEPEVAAHVDLPTDLDRFVDLLVAAAGRAGIDSPRSLWPPELPPHLPLAAISDASGGPRPWWAPMGLIDEPHRQRQSAWGWEGTNLLVYGVQGSGPAAALCTLGCSLAGRFPPDRLHIYGVDFGTRTLAPLEELPHVGSVIAGVDRERLVRLLRHLQDEVSHRRATGPGDRPLVLVLLDNYGGFSAAFDQPADLVHRDALRRIVADGPGVGVFVAMSADQAAALPGNLAALIPEKLVFRMADHFDYAAVGLSNRSLPELPDGRAVHVGSGLVIQVAEVSEAEIVRIAARSSSEAVRPISIGVLPERCPVAAVVDFASVLDREWFLPIGIGDRRLAPVGWRLGESDHVLVAGPSKSGKSTVLLAVAGIVANHRPDVVITAVAPCRSPLWDASEVVTLVKDPDGLEPAVQAILREVSPQLILVDDADDLTDPSGALQRLIRERRPKIRVVGAGRADALRSMYGHWTQELRRSRHGIALRPQADVDGELWHTALPRHGPPVRTPGRGYLISDGEVELVQVAQP